MIVVLLLVLIATTVYFIKIRYEYWNRRGVPGPKPSFFIGNMGPVFCMKESVLSIFSDIYMKYKQFPIVGFFRATTPGLIICDPDLIKDITVKSFNHFHDNEGEISKEKDPLFARNPFFLKGEEWKIVRSQLTPGFTSGKMKLIYPHLEQVSEQLVNFIENQEKAFNGEGYEAKDLCSRFTLNNVACCAFGLDGKCFEDNNSEFRQIALEFLTPGSFQIFVFFIAFLFPAINKLIKLEFVPQNVEDKLTSIVTATLEYREKNNIVRNDFLHILQQLKKTCTAYEFTDVDITAHAAGFFVDGYETSAIVMSFFLHELAANPEAQIKLRAEINHYLQENDGILSYDVIQNLPYLDAALCESLRMHPPIFSLHKVCTKQYTYVPKEGDGIKKPVDIEKGTPIVLPLHGLHHDPRYFENPEVYNPDRFMGENRENIRKYTFLPFGEGPRACLGQRFGILQIKAGVVNVIKNYELFVNKKTKRPIKYDPLGFLTTPVGGLWIDFKKMK